MVGGRPEKHRVAGEVEEEGDANQEEYQEEGDQHEEEEYEEDTGEYEQEEGYEAQQGEQAEVEPQRALRPVTLDTVEENEEGFDMDSMIPQWGAEYDPNHRAREAYRRTVEARRPLTEPCRVTVDTGKGATFGGYSKSC